MLSITSSLRDSYDVVRHTPGSRYRESPGVNDYLVPPALNAHGIPR
ncbi:MAG: hypothetical protein HDR82_01925 [Bacteroides sp.]|nr:hypothetical protein [Bacteroides sp.]